MRESLSGKLKNGYQEFFRARRERELAKSFLTDMILSQSGQSGRRMLEIMKDLKVKSESQGLRVGRIVSLAVDLSYWPDRMKVSDREAEVALEFEIRISEYYNSSKSPVPGSYVIKEQQLDIEEREGLNHERVTYALNVLQNPSGEM